MGNPASKRPAFSIAVSRGGEKKAKPGQKPFPVITAQSYLPGSAAAAGAGLLPNAIPPTGTGLYPGMPYNTMAPPMMNYNTGVGYPPPPYNPMQYSGMPSNTMAPPYNPMQYPGMPSNTMAPPMMNYNARRGLPQPPFNPMQRSGPFPDPRFASYPRHRRRRVCVYRRRSRHCRPIIRMVRSDSCVSISTCSSLSSCSRRCHRSCSYSREHTTSQQQQQQQPIIVLPIQCQQQQPAINGFVQGQVQPIVLPSTQVQQKSIALPTGTNLTSTPVVIQPLSSMGIGQPRQIQAGPIQYVQATPQSTSQLQFTLVKSSSSIPSQHVLVNSTNKNQSTIVKPIQRSVTLRN